jgi:hypothetical protein
LLILNFFVNLLFFFFIWFQLNTLRGAILEDHLISKNGYGNKGGLPHKDVIGFLMPELDLSCLRLADSKINDKLVNFDEQHVRHVFN